MFIHMFKWEIDKWEGLLFLYTPLWEPTNKGGGGSLNCSIFVLFIHFIGVLPLLNTSGNVAQYTFYDIGV